MTIKLIGALLIFAGCGGFGFSMALSYRRAEDSLRQLIRALEYIRCELRYKLAPLPQLCRNASCCVTGSMQQVFIFLAEELEQQIAPDASICMDMALARTPGLPETASRQLSQLGQTLGHFDLAGQLQGIDLCIEASRQEADALSREKPNRIRSYQTLGLCAGAALAILLI